MTVGLASATDGRQYDDKRIRRRVVVLVPAHNEEQKIAATLASLGRQSHSPRLIVVVCDNCTDDTEYIAAREGALALVTVDNYAGTAGALNQALECLLFTTLVQPTDLVLAMDADTELDEHFIANAVGYVEQGYAPGGGNGSDGRDDLTRHEALELEATMTLFDAAALQDIIDSRRQRALPDAEAAYDTALAEDIERARTGTGALMPPACVETTPDLDAHAETRILAAPGTAGNRAIPAPRNRVRSQRSGTLVSAPVRTAAPPASGGAARSDTDADLDRGVAVVVPACNEADQIASTLNGLIDQSLPPRRIIVVANNCVDATGDIARAFGEQSGLQVRVEVLTMANNRHRKAGALNHGLAHLVAGNPGGGLVGAARYVITIDADTILDRHFIQRAVKVLDADPKLGGLSAACRAKAGLGDTPWQKLLTLFQGIEYGRYATTRIRTNVHTMSGAGSVYRSSVLDAQLQSYGYVFAPTSIVEDYTLTLDIKNAGWNVTTNQHCVAYTDLMLTLRSLQAQRIRWCRGTINELRSRGWTRHTAQSIGMILLGLLGIMYLALWSIFTASGMATNGIHPDVTMALWIGFWSGYQVVAARDLGWRIMLFEALLVPGLIFGAARNYWLLRSIASSYGRSMSARLCRVLRIPSRTVIENWS